jgi:hypothetical protein
MNKPPRKASFFQTISTKCILDCNYSRDCKSRNDNVIDKFHIIETWIIPSINKDYAEICFQLGYTITVSVIKIINQRQGPVHSDFSNWITRTIESKFSFINSCEDLT